MSYPQQYPPQQPMQAYPQQPPKKGKAWKIVLGVLIGMFLLCGGGLVACTGIFAAGSAEMERQDNEAAKSVTITNCKGENLLGSTMVTVEYTVKNSTDKARSYSIQFDIYTADGKTRLGEAHGVINSLAAGKTATEKSTPASVDAKQFKCVLGEVSSYSL